MTNKTKKILAGLALGVIGAGTLTGCTSDIVFNQEDLNNAINNVNTYLDTQNGYSSEMAKNTLFGLLMKGLTESLEETSVQINFSDKAYTTYGELSTRNEEFKYYYDKERGLTKIYASNTSQGSVSDDKLYQEITEIPNSDNYNVITYHSYTDLDNDEDHKYYVTQSNVTYNNIEKICGNSAGLPLCSVSDCYSFALGMLSGGTFDVDSIDMNLSTDNYIMEKGDNNKLVFKCIFRNSIAEDGVTIFEFEFKNDELIRIGWISASSLVGGYDEQSSTSIYEWTITRDIEDFSFDTNDFSEYEG